MADGGPHGQAPGRSRSRGARALRLAGSVVVVAVVIVAAGVAMAVHVGLLGGAGSGSGPAPTGGSVPTAAAAGGWQTVDLPTGFSATGISCVSADDCWLIGANHDRNASPAVSAVLRRAWTSVAIAGVGSGALEGSTCASARRLLGRRRAHHRAADRRQRRGGQAAHRARRRGRLQPRHGSPGAGRRRLAVVRHLRQGGRPPGGRQLRRQLRERRGWHRAPAPGALRRQRLDPSALAPPVIDYAGLDGTACLGPDERWASVGTADGGVVEEFDGASWTVVSAPQLAPSPGFSQSGAGRVTCIVADDCWAVGSTGAPTVPDSWPTAASDRALHGRGLGDRLQPPRQRAQRSHAGRRGPPLRQRLLGGRATMPRPSPCRRN